MRWILSFFILCAGTFGYCQNPDAYQSYAEKLGPQGNAQLGEIEVVLQADKIEEIQKEVMQRLLKKGIPQLEAKQWSRVGIIAEDGYWLWLRDAVIFPSGARGTYNRLLWKSGLNGPAGVAVLAIVPEKKVVVNLNFRHATRSWEVELPRGSREPKESAEEAAKRELKEETGQEMKNPIYLGSMAPDSGDLASVVPIYYGEALKKGEEELDFSEAIEGQLFLSKDALKDAFLKGFIETTVRGQKVKAYVRDPFLAYALLQAGWRGLL